MENEIAEGQDVTVRNLAEDDLDALVGIDAEYTGRQRPEYYRHKLSRALSDSGIKMSLIAEQGGMVLGFLMGSVFYGDYGQPEPVASLEAIAVRKSSAGQGVATQLWRQFVRNVKAMRISRVHTQVDWRNHELLTFLHSREFALSTSICLDKTLDFEADD